MQCWALGLEAAEMNGSGKCKHNCDAWQNGINVTRKFRSVRGALEKREITHPGGFCQRKWHLSKSLKEG